MNSPNFSELPQEDQDRIDAYLDGTIEPAEFEALQDRMIADPALRAVMRRCLALDDSLRNNVATVGETSSTAATAPWLGQRRDRRTRSLRRREKSSAFPISCRWRSRRRWCFCSGSECFI